MKKKHIYSMAFIFGVCIMFSGLLAALDSDPEETFIQAKSDFSEFEIIVKRNIFNPDRKAWVDTSKSDVEEVSAPLQEHIILVGVMLNENDAVAFFTGTDSVHNTSVKVGSKIAGYSVARIDTDKIMLKADERNLDIAVGEALVKEGDGEWELSSGPLERTNNSSITSSSDDKNVQGTSSFANSSENDVLKKLMERRQQEL